jgi:uracil-DNA glycosylase
MINIKLPPDWLNVLADDFAEPYMRALREFLVQEKHLGKVIVPPGPEIFTALNSTLLHEVKVVVVGQDPYHGPGQAHGLSFTVKPGVATPPSVQNIYKELHSDLGIPPAPHGCLLNWAQQGVLLLNAILTVELGKAASHQNRGWERFTSKILELINERCEHVVFLLWGTYAQHKGAGIDRSKHLVLTAPHPSPLSAHRGFFGTRPFSQANAYLARHGRTPISWQLPPLVSGHASRMDYDEKLP